VSDTRKKNTSLNREILIEDNLHAGEGEDVSRTKPKINN